MMCQNVEMKKVAVYRKANFNAAHRLYREDWSDEQNKEIEDIQKIIQHRPRNENSIAHQKLLDNCKLKIDALKHNHNIDFSHSL